MRNSLRFFLYSLLLILAITGCQKDPFRGDPPTDPLEEKVTASVQGRVTDENNKPVGNAAVKAGSSTTTTDLNGVFRFTNIQLSKNAGFVLVEKNGYLKGSRTIFTNAGVVNFVEIQLIPKVTRGSFAAGTATTIAIQNGSSVSFPANGVINTTTNTIYTGTVNVIGAWLDPTDPELLSIMPGNLTGLTVSNEQQLLKTFGMIAVELEGAGGEKLNLATGKIATITMPIPASLQGSAPATIPLWYFDETKGIWIEEGSAARQGNNYVGTVSHFTFWNCDVPNTYINLKLTLKNSGGQPLPNYRVNLFSTQLNQNADGYTDSSGMVTGAVPPNVTLQMKVYNRCGNVVHTQNIGPFSAATDLGVVTIAVPATAVINVSGTATNCSSTAVTNGFVDINLEGVNYRAAIQNGSFSTQIERCSNSIGTLFIIAVDAQTGQQSSSTTSFQVTSGNVPVGNLVACGLSTEQYINYTIGTNTINFVPATDSFFVNVTASSANITAHLKDFTDSVNYRFTSLPVPAITPGTYTLQAGNWIAMENLFVPIEYELMANTTITITEFGGQGQYIAGNFSGNFRNKNINGAPVLTGNCSFRVRRR